MWEIKRELTFIPKAENYMQYMIELIMKLPKTEKFGIGNEYKTSMFEMLKNILLLGKVGEEQKFLSYIRRIKRVNYWRDLHKHDIMQMLLKKLYK